VLRISSAISTPSILRHISLNERKLETSMRELASGSRLEGNPQRAADKAIAENLKAQLRSTEALDHNAQTASSMVQVTEGSLNEQSNLLIRMRELAIQSATDTISDEQREYLDYEFQQLKQEVDRIAQTSGYSASPSLDGNQSKAQFLVGTHSDSHNVITYNTKLNTTASGLGISSLDLEDQDEAVDSLEDLDEAFHVVADARAKLGAIQTRFDSASNQLQTQAANLSEAHSRYADSNIAEAVTKMRTAQALQYYQAAALRSVDEFQMAGLKLVG
jgi:flagellin